LKNVIIVRETGIQAWIRDASTLALFVALIGIGVFLKSDAMQWAGAAVAFTTVIIRSSSTAKKNTYTIDEARALLDKWSAA